MVLGTLRSYMIYHYNSVFSTPEIKRFSSWSSDSQELESFSQGSNYSDVSNPSIKKELLKIEVERKSNKLNFLSEFLSEINIHLKDSLKLLNSRVGYYMLDFQSSILIFSKGHKL